jgi:hypothetical protein
MTPLTVHVSRLSTTLNSSVITTVITKYVPRYLQRLHCLSTKGLKYAYPNRDQNERKNKRSLSTCDSLKVDNATCSQEASSSLLLSFG